MSNHQSVSTTITHQVQKHSCMCFISEDKMVVFVFCTCNMLIGSICHALTGTWRPAAQPRSLWGNSPVEQHAPRLGGGREPQAQASPCPHSEQPRGWERGMDDRTEKKSVNNNVKQRYAEKRNVNETPDVTKWRQKKTCFSTVANVSPNMCRLSIPW